MKLSTSPTLVKNIVVALTLGVAAVATWAITKTETPAIEAVTSPARNG